MRVLRGAGRILQAWWGRLLTLVVALHYRGRPAPLGSLLAARRFAFGVDPLVPATRVTRGRDLPDLALAALFPDAELGWWSLGQETLSWLAARVIASKPTRVLEFGSGVSTVVLAKAMRELHPEGRALVVSIEQSMAHAADTNVRLRRADLQTAAHVVVAPLVSLNVQGWDTTCYDIASVVGDLGVQPFDLVVVDGPFGPPRCRFATLPLTAALLTDSAEVVMDDALRDAELWIAAEWSRMNLVQVAGVLILEKGLLLGRVRRSQPIGAVKRPEIRVGSPVLD